MESCFTRLKSAKKTHFFTTFQLFDCADTGSKGLSAKKSEGFAEEAFGEGVDCGPALLVTTVAAAAFFRTPSKKWSMSS